MSVVDPKQGAGPIVRCPRCAYRWLSAYADACHICGSTFGPRTLIDLWEASNSP